MGVNINSCIKETKEKHDSVISSSLYETFPEKTNNIKSFQDINKIQVNTLVHGADSDWLSTRLPPDFSEQYTSFSTKQLSAHDVQTDTSAGRQVSFAAADSCSDGTFYISAAATQVEQQPAWTDDVTAAKMNIPLPIGIQQAMGGKDDPYFMNTPREQKGLPYVKFDITTPEGKQVPSIALWDTGCSHCLVATDFFHHLQLIDKNLSYTEIEDLNVGAAFKNTKSKCIGTTTLNIRFTAENGQTLTFPLLFYIVTNLNDPLFIGSSFIYNQALVIYGTPDSVMLRYPQNAETDSMEVKFHFFTKANKPPTRLVSVSKVTLQPYSLHLVPLQTELEWISPPGQPLPPQDETVANMVVYPSTSFQVGQPYTQLYSTIIENDGTSPMYQIWVENMTDEPIVWRKGLYVAKASPVDMEYEACRLSRDTLKLAKTGELDLTQIVVSNLNTCIDLEVLTGIIKKNDLQCMRVGEIPPYPHMVKAFPPPEGSTAEPTPPMTDAQLDQAGIERLQQIHKEAEELAGQPVTESLPEEMLAQFQVDHLTPEQRTEVLRLCNKYPMLWATGPNSIGKISFMKHKIQLSGELPPTEKRRVFSAAKAAGAMVAINDMLEAGIISPCLSYFASNLHLVAKKGTSEVRVTLDSRRLNSVSVAQRTSTPTTEVLLSELAQQPFRTSLDIKAAYFNMELHEDSRHLTAFHSPNGSGQLYCYNRLPMGHRSSGAAITNAIQFIISSGNLSSFCTSFIDDLVIHSKTFEEHLQHLDAVFSRFSVATVKLGPRKTKFLGDMIGNNSRQRHMPLGRGRMASRSTWLRMAARS